MACGVFHKATKAGKVLNWFKGAAKKVGGVVKKGAQWLWDNKDKVFDVAGKVAGATGNEKLQNFVNKTQDYTNKGLDLAHNVGLVS